MKLIIIIIMLILSACSSNPFDVCDDNGQPMVCTLHNDGSCTCRELDPNF